MNSGMIVPIDDNTRRMLLDINGELRHCIEKRDLVVATYCSALGLDYGDYKINESFSALVRVGDDSD